MVPLAPSLKCWVYGILDIESTLLAWRQYRVEYHHCWEIYTGILFTYTLNWEAHDTHLLQKFGVTFAQSQTFSKTVHLGMLMANLIPGNSYTKSMYVMNSTSNHNMFNNKSPVFKFRKTCICKTNFLCYHVFWMLLSIWIWTHFSGILIYCKSALSYMNIFVLLQPVQLIKADSGIQLLVNNLGRMHISRFCCSIF